jgi:hypothetical protein
MTKRTELNRTTTYSRGDVRGCFMNNLWLVVMCSLLSAIATAQTGSTTTDQEKQLGGFQVEQSVEFGYRFTDVNGNPQLYDSLIDQSRGGHAVSAGSR